MELTLDQALQKGIEAHKAGKVQEADRYYTAILKANSKHPDANHNMGVLAVGVGKVKEAIPFFKIALEANPSIAQYWISYIDALLRLDRVADAKLVFEEAKSKCAKADSFDRIEIRLAAQIEGDQTDKEILGKAIDLRETGKYDQAIDLLLKQIKRSSTDPNILSLLSHCYILTDNLEQAKIYLGAAKDINPNIASIGWTETRLLLKQKKVDEALVVADKTNKLFPDDVEGICVLGSCLRANGNFDESLKYLNQAIELNPNYAEALIHRGLIYLTKNDKANALTDLEKAHHLKPHIKQIWDLLISLIVEAKNYATAIPILIKMIEVDPDHEKNYSLLALCNQEADDPALAIESFEKILEIRPNDAVMHLNLGLAFKKQNKNSKAIENYKKAISIKPDFAEAYNGMGNVLLEQGKLEEAIELYSKALSIKPSYADAYTNMGNAFKEQGQLEQAVGAYKKSLSIEPDNAGVSNNLAVAFQEQGKLEEAIEAFNKTISIEPDNADAYTNMGVTLHDQGKFREAIESYTKALSLKPDYANAYANMGISLHSHGKLKEAIEAYNKTISIEPSNANAYTNMGISLHDQGRLDEAIDAHYKAISIQPNNADAFNNVAIALKDRGKIAEAIEAYDKAISIRPDYADAYKNKSLVKLATEEWKHGIKLREWRWKTKGFQVYRRFFDAPEWNGKSLLYGKTLLIWGEQGPGDMIIWCACLEYYTSIGANVIVECSQKLLKILAISFPEVTVREEKKDIKHDKEDFDFQIPMEKLFGYACLSGKIKGHQKEYIFPDKRRVEHWKDRLKSVTKKPCVGISWKSPVMNSSRQPNYADLSFWKLLLQNDNYTFFNFQSSDFKEDLEKISRDYGVEVINFDELDHYNDLAEVAAFLKALDISISVATTAAHISAAVGTHTIIPTWRQSSWNNILFNSRGPKIELFYRNSWESWENTFTNIAKTLS